MTEREQLLQQAIAALEPADMTSSGKPKVSAINARLPEGADPATAAERDAAWEAAPKPVETEPALEDAPEGEVRIRVKAAPPIPLVHVHGVGDFELPAREEPYTVPAEIAEFLTTGTDGWTFEEVAR